MVAYQLGKKPASTPIKLKLGKYIDLSVLPTPPQKFGHSRAFGDWGMLGNDEYGDCVFAGAAHETMLWNKQGGHHVSFSDSSVLSDYSAVTGFDPLKPNTDQGTDMVEAAKYRQDTGVEDATGKRHKVEVYAAIATGDWAELRLAAYLFDAVGIGIKFPASAMAQFNAGEKWEPVRGSKIEGGHYVPVIGCSDRLTATVVTWGRAQAMSQAFFEKYCDEAIVYLSFEDLRKGKSRLGFDVDQLQADLAKLRK